MLGGRGRRFAGVAIAAGALLVAGSAGAQDAGPGATVEDAGAPSAGDDAGAVTDAGEDGAAPSPTEALQRTAHRIYALIEGTLDPAVEPASLFSTSLDLADDEAVSLELRRLSLLLVAASPDGGGPDAGPGDAGPTDDQPTDAGTDGSDELWQARLAVDAARRAFLMLPTAQRTQLLEKHAERQRKAEEDGAPGTEAERRAREAASERERTLEEAKNARTASRRLLAEERARLLGVKESQAQYEAKLQRDEEAVAAIVEETISWGAKVAALIDKLERREATAEQADLLYDALVPELRETTTELSTALGSLRQAAGGVPGPGKSQVASLDEADRGKVDDLYREVSDEYRRLQTERSELAWKRLETLHKGMESLRSGRLALLPWLSADHRGALEGLGAKGVAQATEEARQVAVTMRYHARSSTRSIVGLIGPNRDRSTEVGIGLTGFKVLLSLGVFAWWRRFMRRRVLSWRKAASGAGARSRLSDRAQRWQPLLGLVLRIRRPLEWLLLIIGLMWLLGPSVAGRIEARLVWLIFVWLLGGRLAIGILDELLARQGFLVRKETETSALRLRSLRLVGRSTVLLGLTLALTSELVGEATIYRWVTWLCWLVALPVAMLVVHWWRPIIYKRLETRQSSRIARWALSHRRGWLRLVAAPIGSVYVFGLSLGRAIQSTFGRFDLTRRLLAYWFRREVSKQSEELRGELELAQLDEGAYRSLDPGRRPAATLPALNEAAWERLMASAAEPRGEVIAVVGERGSGKSTLLASLALEAADVLAIPCPAGGGDEFRQALAAELGLDATADGDTIRERVARGAQKVVIIDDAHRVVRRRIGGIQPLDALLELVGARSGHTGTWIVGIDAVTWRFVQRIRGDRPVFDDVVMLDPWPEERIAELLQQRSKSAGIAPSFERMLTEEPIDDQEHQELLERAETNYYRLLWDYAGGNPAVALWFWRESLRMGKDEDHVVQLFQAPDTSDLEGLPDYALFVLRSILQVDWASFDDVVSATTLPVDRVREALRYAKLKGYVDLGDDRYWVNWTWYRAITRVLHRRHLLAGGLG